MQTAIDNCGLDPGLFWQWQHCLDQRAKLDKQLLHELGQDSRQLSEYSKNVATELVVALRGMLDQVFCCLVAAIARDCWIAKLVSCSCIECAEAKSSTLTTICVIRLGYN